MEHASATTHAADARHVAEAIRRSRFEVIPLDGIEELVLEHVPIEVTLTVTASPSKGLAATFDLVERLARQGYPVVPHLAARMVASRVQLGELVSRCAELDVREVFVVAGDAQVATGPYQGALALLDDLAELGHRFTAVGIAGYPEGHPLLDAEAASEALRAKAAYATSITSQVCFDPSATARWIEGVWARGTRLPLYVGVPGAVSRAKLLRVSSRIGVGDSLRFLRKQGSFASRLLRGGFSPDPIVDGLDSLLAAPDGAVAGFHVFTFNDLPETMAWRRARLGGP